MIHLLLAACLGQLGPVVCDGQACFRVRLPQVNLPQISLPRVGFPCRTQHVSQINQYQIPQNYPIPQIGSSVYYVEPTPTPQQIWTPVYDAPLTQVSPTKSLPAAPSLPPPPPSVPVPVAAPAEPVPAAPVATPIPAAPKKSIESFPNPTPFPPLR